VVSTPSAAHHFGRVNKTLTLRPGPIDEDNCHVEFYGADTYFKKGQTIHGD